MPDGCVDLIWLAGRQLVVAGPATEPQHAALPPDSTTVGVRWRPGAGAPALGLPLDALRDATVPLEELWGADRAEALAERLAAASPAGQLELLHDAVEARVRGAGAPDRLVLAACREVARSARAGRIVAVRALADALGVSERQLLRRFGAAVGYGPRTLARVLRFQRFLAAAWGPPTGSAPLADATAPFAEAVAGSSAGGTPLADAAPKRAHAAPLAAPIADGAGLAELAAEAGYADQSHLTRECRRLAGTTPAALLAGR